MMQGWKSSPDLSIDKGAESGLDLLNMTGPDVEEGVTDHANTDSLLETSTESEPAGENMEVQIITLDSGDEGEAENVEINTSVARRGPRGVQGAAHGRAQCFPGKLQHSRPDAPGLALPDQTIRRACREAEGVQGAACSRAQCSLGKLQHARPERAGLGTP